MALVDAGKPCALCHSPIEDPMRDTFAMTMWGIEDARFAVLDDAACHQACIDRWELRDEFVHYYNLHCKNELFVNRNGHVTYRFDYWNWLAGAVVVSLAVLLCLPSLALLELHWRARTTRIVVFAFPYLMLAALVCVCTIKWSIGVSLRYAAVAWIISTIVTLLAVLVLPASLRRYAITKKASTSRVRTNGRAED